MLEHIIATVILKVAYLATGLILCFIGKGLLEKGITGGFKGEGQVASTKFRVVTSSPGLVFLVAGLAIVIAAIVYQTQFTASGETTSATPRGTGAESLVELAQKTTVMSRMVQSSPEARFALSQYDASERSARSGDIPAAVAYLVRAVVLQPQVLQQALGSPDLKQVVRDPVFEAVVRERFRLPLEIAAPPAEANRAIFGQLRLYLAMHPERDESAQDVASLQSAIPLRARQESEETTLGNLQSMLSKNPRTLLALLEDQRYRWILENDTIVNGLRARIDELNR